MVHKQPSEPLEINAFNTIARLTILQTQNEHIYSTCTQPMYISSFQLTKTQTVILHQFSMIM